MASQSSELVLPSPESPALTIVKSILLGLLFTISLYASFHVENRILRHNHTRWPPKASRTKEHSPKSPLPTGKPRSAHAILGVPRNATRSQIRKRYHQLALTEHPDKQPENRQAAEEQFVRYNAAYKMLMARPVVTLMDSRTHTPKPRPGSRPEGLYRARSNRGQQVRWDVPDLAELLTRALVAVLVFYCCRILVSFLVRAVEYAYDYVSVGTRTRREEGDARGQI